MNYQQGGNKYMQAYSIYLDKVNFTSFIRFQGACRVAGALCFCESRYAPGVGDWLENSDGRSPLLFPGS